MNVLVYGAGVLGSLYAAKLKQAGHEVTILARGRRLEEIRRDGIILIDETDGRRTVVPVPAVGALGPDDRHDLIVVIMRRDQVGAILPTLAAHRATPSILFMMNNAAGPDEFIAAVGRERVLFGFPGAGGARQAGVVHYSLISSRAQVTTVGELDGALTPRVSELVAALEGAGFPAAVSENMDAWLKTHAAVVVPVAGALYLAGDNYRLARHDEGLRLLVAAVKEGFRALESLGIPVTPAKLRVLRNVPDWLLVAILRRVMATKRSELVMMRHADVARGEMKVLAEELLAVTGKAAGVTTPALRRLCEQTAEAAGVIDKREGP